MTALSKSNKRTHVHFQQSNDYCLATAATTTAVRTRTWAIGHSPLLDRVDATAYLFTYTCRHPANLCPAFLVAVTYAQLVVVNWTSPVSICPRTGDGRLPTPVLHPGTRCLTISRTLIFPF